MPEIYDPDGDSYTITSYSNIYNLSLPVFTVFTNNYYIFVPRKNDVGIYRIYIKLKDNNANPKENKYSFYLNVTE